MAITIPQYVQPGQLITAAALNEFVVALQALARQLDGHGGTSVVITDVEPRTVAVGDIILIGGRNFGFSKGAHEIHFGTVQPTQMRESSDVLLKCAVPPIPGLPDGGAAVTLRVTNSALRSTDSTTITVLPSDDGAPTGDGVDVRFVQVLPAPSAGAASDFRFAVSATPPAQVRLAPTVSFARSAQTADATTLDTDLGQPPGSEVAAGPVSTKATVRVEIPALAAGRLMWLAVKAITDDGREVTVRSPSMTVAPRNAKPDLTLTPLGGMDAAIAFSGDAVTVRVGVRFHVAGTYTFVLEQVPGTSGWVMAFDDASTPLDVSAADRATTTVSVTSTDLQSGEAHELIFTVAVGPGDATPGGTLRLTGYRRKGQSTGQSLDFDLTDERRS